MALYNASTSALTQRDERADEDHRECDQDQHRLPRAIEARHRPSLVRAPGQRRGRTNFATQRRRGRSTHIDAAGSGPDTCQRSGLRRGLAIEVGRRQRLIPRSRHNTNGTAQPVAHADPDREADRVSFGERARERSPRPAVSRRARGDRGVRTAEHVARQHGLAQRDRVDVERRPTCRRRSAGGAQQADRERGRCRPRAGCTRRSRRDDRRHHDRAPDAERLRERRARECAEDRADAAHRDDHAERALRQAERAQAVQRVQRREEAVRTRSR